MSLRAAEYNKAPLCRDKHASYSTIHSVKLDMNALKRIFSPRKKKNPLLEGGSQSESSNALAQDAFTCDEQQHDSLVQELHKSGCDREGIIQKTVSQTLPKPPADLPQNLSQYLRTVQETMCRDLVGRGPHLKNLGLMGTLVESYHRQIFHCLNNLQLNDVQSLFSLMSWVLQTYLSQEMFGHHSLQGVDVIKNIDLLQLTEWVTSTKVKLLHSVREKCTDYLKNIQEIDRIHIDQDDEEACVGFYVDVIQMTEAMTAEAGRISPLLEAEVWEVCFQELLKVLQRYTVEQKEILDKKKKINKGDMIYFLKTLKTCKEIKQHIRTKMMDVTRGLLQDIVAALEHMEQFTLARLKKMMSNVVKTFLKSYFTGKHKQFCQLMNEVQDCFPNRQWCQDVMEEVMVELYKIIAHTYLRSLVKVRQDTLTRCWSTNIDQTVTEDAEFLHDTISELVPGVAPFNLILLKVAKMPDCDNPDMMLLTTAFMQVEFPILREDQDLQVALLRWKGLSAKQVRRVMEALPGQHTSRSVLWYCCLA